MQTKRIILMLLFFLGLQSCTIYNRIPTPIDQAVQKGKVKMVQKQVGKPSNPITITTEYKNIFLIKDQVYGGQRKDNMTEPLLYNPENTFFYLKNRKKSITATILTSVMGGVAAAAATLGVFYLVVSAMWY